MMEAKIIEDKVEQILTRVFRGTHNVPSWKRREVNTTVHGLKMSLPTGEMSTYDADALTRLVIACHDECVRFEIQGGTPGYLTVWFHVREGRTGDKYWKRHPTMEQALARVRESYDENGVPRPALVCP